MPQRIPWQESPFLVSEEFGAVKKNSNLEYSKLVNEKLIEHEQLESNSQLEAELYLKQKKRNQELLEQLLHHQNQNVDLVNQLQQQKNTERNRLIDDILKAEKNANIVVQNLLNLKNEPDPALLEEEHREQQLLLEQLILAVEAKRIENYQDQRDITARNILNHEHESNELLSTIFVNNDRDRTEVVIKIMQDEDLQKSAVASLIAENDSRTWGLIEQMRIVESQLAAMTCCEIERKKLCADEQFNEQASQRLNLTYSLIDLMEQQEKRRKQLLDTIVDLEHQNENQQKDFWLLQYQKLIDSRPVNLSTSANSIDPAVPCKWCGSLKAVDRSNILLSIQQFLDNNRPAVASAPNKQNSVPDDDDQRSTNTSNETGELLAECVVCMENSCKIIFIPCGHLCCCENCHSDLQLCPMCRSQIDLSIKVIQPKQT